MSTPQTDTTLTATEPTSTDLTDTNLQTSVHQLQRRRRWLARRDVLLAILTPIVLLAIWEILARTGVLDARLFTPPTGIVGHLGDMVVSGELWTHLQMTIMRLGTGYLVGGLIGIIFGLFMGIWRPLNAALGPTFTALYALPKIAILPLLLLIFGLTETPRILAVGISVFFVMQINTVAGIVQIDARILEAARAYNATGYKLFTRVLLPGAMPNIMTGLRVSAGMSVIVVTAVEFVASNEGLGYLIWNSWQLFQPERMYVGLIVVSLVGAAVTGIVIVAERLLLPWKYTSSPTKE